MVITDLVIARMNQLAGDANNNVLLFVDEQETIKDEVKDDTTNVQMKTHIVNPDINPETEQKAIENQPAGDPAVSDSSKDSNGSERKMNSSARSQKLTSIMVRRSRRSRWRSIMTVTEETSTATRRSVRIAEGTRRPSKYSFHTSVKKALQEYGEDAYEAIKAEILQLFRKNNALVPVLRSSLTTEQHRKIIRSSMFLKTKFDPMGFFEKIKAR
jgi:hypothetical protein